MNPSQPSDPPKSDPARPEATGSPHDQPTVRLSGADGPADDRDEALGEQLGRDLDALQSGRELTPGRPELGPDLDRLRPVVRRLHALAGFLGGPDAPARPDPDETIDLAGPSDGPDTKRSAPPEAPHEAPVGPRVGKYEVVCRLGGGGQATAYLAFDPDLRRQVVIKLYHQARAEREQERILQEGRALARVRSPYVARCFSAERHDGVPYLVVE